MFLKDDHFSHYAPTIEWKRVRGLDPVAIFYDDFDVEVERIDILKSMGIQEIHDMLNSHGYDRVEKTVSSRDEL